ncbi:MAG: hypothetical protein QME94_01375 [Anaerolineae bacterium]|nr:hypothetical protein [Anaerolineae bacterium]
MTNFFTWQCASIRSILIPLSARLSEMGRPSGRPRRWQREG